MLMNNKLSASVVHNNFREIILPLILHYSRALEIEGFLYIYLTVLMKN